MSERAERQRAAVREEYGRIARTEGACCVAAAQPGCGCGGGEGGCCESVYTREELAGVPVRGAPDLGSGVPVRYAGLQPGDRVLDLGSGGGLDAFVAAKAVGRRGRVIGVDLTPDMVDRARRAARHGRFGARIDFRVGTMERLPFQDETFDVVLSNCAINLSPEKPRVFREAFRVLKPGGRLSIDDIVRERPLEPSEADGVGCVVTADLRRNYLTAIRRAGFRRARILVDRPYLVRDGRTLASAIAVRADKPRHMRRSGGPRGADSPTPIPVP